MKHTINKQRKVTYVALNFATGLTDLILYVRKPNGDMLDPILMTEQGEGIYYAVYTPDMLGVWQEKVSSASNGDVVIRTYTVVAYDEDDVYQNVEDVKGKVDEVKNSVNALSGDISYIKQKVDSIDQQVNPGGYFA